MTSGREKGPPSVTHNFKRLKKLFIKTKHANCVLTFCPSNLVTPLIILLMKSRFWPSLVIAVTCLESIVFATVNAAQWVTAFGLNRYRKRLSTLMVPTVSSTLPIQDFTKYLTLLFAQNHWRVQLQKQISRIINTAMLWFCFCALFRKTWTSNMVWHWWGGQFIKTLWTLQTNFRPISIIIKRLNNH